MAKKHKGMNNVVAKNILVNTIESSIQKVDDVRWANTDEGRLKLIQEKTKQENEAFKAKLDIGQLVWKTDVAHSKDAFEESDGILVNRCGRIINIFDDSVEVEFLFAVSTTGTRFDTYMDICDFVWEKGVRCLQHFIGMEKHIAKNGNTWWKVK